MKTNGNEQYISNAKNNTSAMRHHWTISTQKAMQRNAIKEQMATP